MKGFILGIIVMLNFVLESTLFHNVAVLGVKPDIALIIAVVIAVLMGKDCGALVGVANGILQDVVFGKPIGLTAISYMLAGYIVGLNSEKIFKENFVVPVFFTAGATIIRHTVALFFYYVYNLNFPVLDFLKNVIMIELLYNCIVSIPVYFGLKSALEKDLIRKGFKLKRSRRI